MTSHDPLRQAEEGLPARALVIVVVVSTVIGLSAIAVAWWLTPAAHLQPTREQPAGPVAGVEQRVMRDVARSSETQAAERARLERYQWVDAGVARIPIERAMELVERGCRPAGAGAPAFRGGSERAPCSAGGAP